MLRQTPRTKPAAVAYHHGALREALLEAAESILLEQGIQGFTLRACARRANVSHAAPAHHFGDVRGLLTSFAAVGFNRMADLMKERRDAAASDPVEQLVAVGQAYIDFALHHRAHFQLMFQQDRLDAEDASLQAAAQRTAQMLSEAMVEVTLQRGLPQSELPARMLLAWSAVHGFSTLVVEGQCTQAFGLDVGDAARASAAASQVLTLLSPALSSQAIAASPKRKSSRL
jgi:AcrR family transcriptional regulator